MTAGRRLRRAVGIAVAVLLGLTVAIGASAFAYLHRYPTRVEVPIRASGPTTSTGWSLGPRAVLATDDAGPTRVFVQVTRNGDASLPAARAEFDGSGGGEAVVVDCGSTSTGARPVPPGRAEWVALDCDHHVDPWALAGLKWLPVTAD